MSRTPSGCKRCRETHQKCVAKPPSKECLRCIAGNVSCLFENRTRFKNVSHVPLKRVGAGRGNARFRLSYSRRQQWVDIPRSLSFIEEKGDVDDDHALEERAGVPGQNDQAPGPLPLDISIEYNKDVSPPEQAIGDNRSAVTLQDASAAKQLYSVNPASPLSEVSHASGNRNTNNEDQQRRLLVSEPFLLSPYSGVVLAPLGQSSASTSTAQSGVQEPTSINHSNALLLSKREAYLMRNFIEVVSTWLDACDVQRHFANIVPQRALHSSVLLYAVFASSADHQLQIRKNDDETESIGYHDECLNRLIPALSQQEAAIDETLLSAVTILRIVEEFSADDHRCHLLGTTRILNSISSFASSGGLGEACAWLSLRQNSYVAFVNQEPLVTLLKNYEKSTAFKSEDDGSWANRIVFVFARALTLAFGSEIPSENISWSQLRDETEHWFQKKPRSFMPMWTDLANSASGRPFSQPWLLGAPQVVALQHYHLTKILIAAFIPQPQLTGFHGLLNKSNTEGEVLQNLRLVIGLCQANKTQLIGFFAASHALSVCGFLLRDTAERKQAVDLLKEMSKRIGWRTSVKRLEHQWGLEKQSW